MSVIAWTDIRMRFVAAGFTGSVAYAVSFSLHTDLRIAIAYDLAIATYLLILVARMSCADGETTRDLAEKKESSNWAILMLAGLLSLLSLCGIGLMLHRSQDLSPAVTSLRLGSSLVAVFLSWTLLHTMFGIHYARLYYDPRTLEGTERKPLEFPDDEFPDFWDFMYFSFTLAVCYQVSDIAIRCRRFRRVVLAHVLLSFLNVTMILGLVVEIVSTLANPQVPLK